jgi:hypothetical protein
VSLPLSLPLFPSPFPFSSHRACPCSPPPRRASWRRDPSSPLGAPRHPLARPPSARPPDAPQRGLPSQQRAAPGSSAPRARPPWPRLTAVPTPVCAAPRSASALGSAAPRCTALGPLARGHPGARRRGPWRDSRRPSLDARPPARLAAPERPMHAQRVCMSVQP